MTNDATRKELNSIAHKLKVIATGLTNQNNTKGIEILAEVSKLTTVINTLENK